MIFNKEKRVLIWTPYASWSTSIMSYFNVLEPKSMIQLGLDTTWEVFISNSPSSCLYNVLPNRHGLGYPDVESTQYKKILILRNPYDRVLSMWKKHISHGIWKEDSLDHFLGRVFMFHPYSYPACRMFEEHYDEVVCVEDLQDRFEELGIADFNKKPFPHLNKSDPSDYQLTKRQKNIISHFHYSDFVVGKYAF
jgi:hypothetical protein